MCCDSMIIIACTPLVDLRESPGQLPPLQTPEPMAVKGDPEIHKQLTIKG